MREPSEEIDFGPAEPEGRSQTRPVEISLEGSRIPKGLSLIRLIRRFRCSLVFLLYLMYIQQEVLV